VLWQKPCTDFRGGAKFAVQFGGQGIPAWGRGTASSGGEVPRPGGPLLKNLIGQGLGRRNVLISHRGLQHPPAPGVPDQPLPTHDDVQGRVEGVPLLHEGIDAAEFVPARAGGEAPSQALLVRNPRLLLLNVPCLLIYSTGDSLVRPPDSEMIASMNRMTHLFLLDNEGDLPMVASAGKFSRLVLDFLSLPPGETPRKMKLKDEWKRRFR